MVMVEAGSVDQNDVWFAFLSGERNLIVATFVVHDSVSLTASRLPVAVLMN